MNREELQERYDEGDLDDPTVLQDLRDEIYMYTGLEVPRSVSDIEAWWSNYKSTFARRIKPSDVSKEVQTDEEDEDNQGDQE